MKTFKRAALSIITITVVLIAALNISSYIGQVRQEMKARDYALRACVVDAPTSAALQYAAIAASLDDQYNLQSEYLMALKRMQADPYSAPLEVMLKRGEYQPALWAAYMEQTAMSSAVTGLCRTWKTQPISWWPWE